MALGHINSAQTGQTGLVSHLYRFSERGWSAADY